MSILNRPSDGLFNILIPLVRCLLVHGAMPREKLLKLCAPPSAVDSQERASQTINRWIQLGLLQSDDSGTLSIDIKKHKELNKTRTDNAMLARIIRSHVLLPDSNQRLWESENNQAADFTRAVSWMLAQDVFEFDRVGHVDVQQLELDQLDHNHSAFTNDTRWAGFKSWATFLGFGWIGRFPSGVFVIDPTVAVRDLLPTVFVKKGELAHNVFFDSLANSLPVVDGGEYRRQVEDKIDRTVWSTPAGDEISTSLSRALIRLHEAGDVILHDRADADKTTLLGRAKRRIRNVSHIEWKGGNR